MNKFLQAITDLDIAAVREFVKEPKWLAWSEPDGKNALHYLCGLRLSGDAGRSKAALDILKLLLKAGMDINSVHRIDDKNCDYFPATPLWYAYTRGRNETVYKYLLKQGANTNNCWWAIAWYDDIPAAKLWLRHGAKIDKRPSLDDLFVGSFQWKKYDFADWLLGQGADVNAFGPDGNSALMIAVKRKDEDSIKWLFKAGADADKTNAQGLSARKIAETKGPKRIADLLR